MMGYHSIEDSRMYQPAERIADEIWQVVIKWEHFSKDTIGKQLVRACDSIGANLAESGGKNSTNDVIRFIYYSMGSLRETNYWLKRATQRQLLSKSAFTLQSKELEQLGKELNAYIRYQRKRTNY